MPDALAGVLFRNGPARFDRAGFRYSHWFDGDGMVQAWRFGRGGVTHDARMIATSKFVRERKAGRFLVPAGGTTVPGAVTVRNNDDMNTANTALVRHGGRLFALWEGGSAIELNPDDLATLGPVTWREELVAAPFSAHPQIDRDGSLWNFGSLSMLGGSGLLIWRIGADGKLIRAATLATESHGYLHSFVQTDRHLVFMLMPYHREGAGVSFFEQLRFLPDQPCRVAVVPKDAPDTARWFEAPFGAVYHFGNAYVNGSEIFVQAVRHRDLEQMRSPMSAAMRGERDASFGTDLAVLRLDLASGRARWESRDVRDLEFPAFDPRWPDAKAARIYAPVTVEPNRTPYSNAVAAIDVERGRRDVHRYGADVMAEEHVFVPKPGSRKPGQGWLIGTVLDTARGRSGMTVLDAERVAAGPLATAWVPYTLPLGFHGTFVAKA